MKVKTTILTAFAGLAIGAATTIALPTASLAMDRKVECTDGTIFKLGNDDAILDSVACNGHGGVKPKGTFIKKKISKNSAVPLPKPVKRF